MFSRSSVSRLLQGQLRKYATSPWPEIRKDDTLGKTIFAALEEMQTNGTLKSERVLTTPQGPWIRAHRRNCDHSRDRVFVDADVGLVDSRMYAVADTSQ